jgi:hypothetical protein
MIEPIKGKLYKIKYIGGTLYSNQEYKTFAIFLKISKDKENYIFGMDISEENRYWIVYVSQENILEYYDSKSIELSDIENLELYISKSPKFFTTSINKQSHSCYIEYYDIANFLDEYYKPETGEGYLEALASWNSREPSA